MLVLAAVLLGGMVWAPMAAAADYPAWVQGKAYGQGYQFSNLPLAGASVELWQYSGTSPSWAFDDTGFGAISVFDGGFAINALTQDDDVGDALYYTGANCFLVATATNYAVSTDLSTYIPAAFPLKAWQLQAQSVSVTVLPTAFNGVVKHNNKALKGVKVAVAGKSVNTDSKGKWKISGMLLKPGAKYQITFTKKGYKKIHIHKTSLPNATRDCGTVTMKHS